MEGGLPSPSSPDPGEEGLRWPRQVCGHLRGGPSVEFLGAVFPFGGPEETARLLVKCCLQGGGWALSALRVSASPHTHMRSAGPVHLYLHF